MTNDDHVYIPFAHTFRDILYSALLINVQLMAHLHIVCLCRRIQASHSGVAFRRRIQASHSGVAFRLRIQASHSGDLLTEINRQLLQFYLFRNDPTIKTYILVFIRIFGIYLSQKKVSIIQHKKVYLPGKIKVTQGECRQSYNFD